MKIFAGYLGALLVLISINFTALSQNVEFEGYKEINGVNLFFKVVGTGEPILIVHGGPAMNHDYFLPHLTPLAKSYQLIFYDQRSSGRSYIPDDSSRSISHRIMVEDIEAIRKEFGIRKLNLFAHSWGAKLAVNYALQYPRQAGVLILSNPVAFSHDYDSAQRAVIAQKTNENDAQQRKRILESDAFRYGDLGSYEALLRITYKTSFFDTLNVAKLDIVLPDNFFQQNAHLMKGLYTDFKYYDLNYYPQLKELRSPVLILHGRADNIPLAAGERLQASMKDAQLVVFDRSGHFPFIEENEKFTNTIGTFMKRGN
jgi:proline iminopeptidase